MHIVCKFACVFHLKMSGRRENICWMSSNAGAENVIKMSLMSVTSQWVCVCLKISLIACAVYRSHKKWLSKSEKMLVHGKFTVMKRVQLSAVCTAVATPQNGACNSSNGTSISIIRSIGKVKKNEASFDYILAFRIKTFFFQQ